MATALNPTRYFNHINNICESSSIDLEFKKLQEEHRLLLHRFNDLTEQHNFVLNMIKSHYPELML